LKYFPLAPLTLTRSSSHPELIARHRQYLMCNEEEYNRPKQAHWRYGHDKSEQDPNPEQHIDLVQQKTPPPLLSEIHSSGFSLSGILPMHSRQE
jgi:hypothetical protein